MVRSLIALFLLVGAVVAQERAAPTFYRDVAPILQAHCQRCHRPGEIAPMALVSYADTRPSAAKIAAAVQARAMPPWFANPGIGHFANDPSLTTAEIRTLVEWAADGAPAGDARTAPPSRHWAAGWNIASPDAVIAMPSPVAIPAHGMVEYTYEIVTAGAAAGRWVEAAEIRPSSRAHVHHAVVYIRPPGSHWLKGAPRGRAFTAASLLGAGHTSKDLATTTDLLLVYAPGSAPGDWGRDRGKYIPPGSDLVFQMHYTTNGSPATDQTSVGLKFSSTPPAERVLTLQLTNSSFVIPPGVDNFRIEVHGSLPGPATLLSFFPHMHLRGKRFEYNLVSPTGKVTPLLQVSYNFYWQLSYVLAQPLSLPAGTELQAVGWYDNSANNPHNPDPSAAVYWGDQTSDEMMVGFFDVAVPAKLDKDAYFAERGRTLTGHRP